MVVAMAIVAASVRRGCRRSGSVDADLARALLPAGPGQKSPEHLILFCAALGEAVGWRIFR